MHVRHWSRRLVVCAALTTMVASFAFANGRGRHKRMFAVPVPGKVAIDGKLDDWDLSGQILIYVTSETSESQSAKFALMYDNEALYLSAIVRDTTPMMNRHNPWVDADKGWDADACQFRIVLDPSMGHPVDESAFNYRGANKAKDTKDQIVHLTLWYYTDRKEPNLQMSIGMGYRLPREEWGPHGAVPHDRFQAAYCKSKDGRGYTFEYRIPWTTLGAKNPLKGGDLVAGTVQFNWSRPDGLKTAGGAAWAYDVMSRPGFPYQESGCWGKIIFAEKGNLPRDLVEEGTPPERPLPLTFEYDLLEEGEVTVALFDQNGYVARNLVVQGKRLPGHVVEKWDGLDESGRPLPPGKYIWKGLYHEPIKTKFILSVHNSGRPPYKLDDNTGGWGGDHGTPTTVCAAGQTMILAWSSCESGWGIIRTDLKGKKLWGSKHNAEYLATDGKRLCSFGGHGFYQAHGVKVFDLKDCRPLNYGNRSAILTAPEGGDEGTNRATGLAYHDGIIFVAYSQRDLIALFDAKQGILKDTWRAPSPGRMAVRPDGSLAVISGGKVVSVSRGRSTPLIEDYIDEPAGVAVDPAGVVYVTNRGALQDVSVFSPQGKYLRSIGKRGGRPRVGRYDKSGVLEPGGIAVDSKGRLWVAETLDGPKRHSVWDTKTGECVNEFFGGSAYFGWAYMDPKHPDEVYCHNVLWKVDLAKRTWKPRSTIWRATAPNMVRAANPGGYAGHFRVMTAKNGRQFGWGMVNYGNVLYMRDGDTFKPIAGSIGVYRNTPFGGGVLYPVMDDPKHFPDGAYLWQDANDDQTVQADELVKSPSQRREKTFNWIDPDLNVWCDEGLILRPVRIERDGRPVYDFGKREPIPFKGSNANATSLWLDPDNDTVYTLNPGRAPGLAAWTRDKKLLWGYRRIVLWNRALNLGLVKPGKLWGLTMPLGVAGDYTGAATYFGPYHIFTRDGLYVAMVMRDGRSGGLGPDITASETITGQLVKPEGMERYFLLAGDQDGRITEILGLDTVKRLKGGTYNLTPHDAKKAVDALAEYEKMKAKSQKLILVRGVKSLDLAKGIQKVVDADRSFTARAAYDNENLYVSFDVTSPNQLVNAISDPKMIFKGGNLLDIQIAADPKADLKRKKPAPGDLRMLVSRQAGKPIAVIFRPKLKGFRGEPIVLSSPTGKEAFDSITISRAIKLAYKKKPGGFKAKVTIPLSEIGLTLKPGQTVRMDLGYIFGNKTGTQTAIRAYWSNNSFSANVIGDIPNESRLEPHEWGEAVVE